MRFFNKIVFSMILFSIFGCKANYGKLLLTVYYEGKCSDTARFILNQLVPTTQKLQDYIYIKFVPFGKAHSVQGGKGFVCQHGPSECLSNMIMDCALNYLNSTPDVVKVDYVACEMKTFAASRGSLQCIQHIPAVETCASSQQGIALQLNSEYLTNLVNPTFIPTVTVNGVFDQQTQDLAMRDLFGMLCNKLGNIPPCESYNIMRSNSVDYFMTI